MRFKTLLATLLLFTLCVSPTFAAATFADTVMSFGPVAYYRLDDASGSFVDYTGNGNTMTPSGATWTYSQPGLLLGDTDTAMKLALSGARALAATQSSSLWSIMLLLKINGAGAANWNYSIAEVNGICVGLGFSTHTYIAVGSDSALTSSCVIGTSFTISTGTTYFVVAENVNANLSKISLNNGAFQNNSATGTGTTHAIQSMLGSSSDTGGMTIILDEVAFFPTSLSSANVSTLYSASQGVFSGADPSFMGSWSRWERARFIDLLDNVY